MRPVTGKNNIIWVNKKKSKLDCGCCFLILYNKLPHIEQIKTISM